MNRLVNWSGYGFALLAAVLIAPAAFPEAAFAYHDENYGHPCPVPPKKNQYHFAPDFAAPYDSETLTAELRKPTEQGGCGGDPWRVAGFGGAPFQPEPNAARLGEDCRKRRSPVIFVHGNHTDAGDWYPVLAVFAESGYTMCQLWGISYNGAGANAGRALFTNNPTAESERGDARDDFHTTNNMLNVADIEHFIRAVLKYTREKQFSMVSHSLGVTLARKTLQLNPDLRSRLDRFVGIAGGNHGSTFCDGQQVALMMALPYLVSCDELTTDVPPVFANEWLHELNTPDETPGPAEYMTIYDGSGITDPAFFGPDRDSPRLEGALNCTFPGAYHNDLRVDPVIASVYVAFLAYERLPEVEPGDTPAAPVGGLCN